MFYKKIRILIVGVLKKLSMNKEQRKELWKKDTNELYCVIGEFIVKFQFVCHTIQTCILFLLDLAGLHNQSITQILLVGLTAEPLRTLFESLVVQTQTLNDKEQKILKDVLNRFKKLTEERNDIIHGTWFIGLGNESTTDFSEASGMKFRKNKGGAVFKSFKRKAEYFRELSEEADSLARIFQKLDACFYVGTNVENNFVISTDGRVSVLAG